jgi:radical SAM protein with 4Fe4S-binding SPASM domain
MALFKVGSTCSNNCSFCYALNCKAKRDKSLPDITHELANTRMECGTITLPCNTDSRRDFFDIVGRAKALGFAIALQTNARMFSQKEFCDRVTSLVDNFEVIFQLPNDAESNENRLALAGIENLRAAKGNVAITVPVDRSNSPYLAESVGILEKFENVSVVIANPHPQVYREIDRLKSKKIRIVDLPFEVKVEVTAKCNLNCDFCFNENAFSRDVEDLPKERVFEVIEKIAASGVKRIRFTGGEPFMRKDFVEILQHAKSCGLTVLVNSNATLIENEDIPKLVTLVDQFLLPFHSLSPEYLENLELAKLMKDNGAAVFLNTVLTKENVKNLERYVELIDKSGLDWFLARPVPNSANKMPLTNDDVKVVIEKLITLKGRHLEIDSIPFCAYDPEKVKLFSRGANNCGLFNKLVVDPAGKIKPCYSINEELDSDLEKAWSKGISNDVRNLRVFPETCKKCRYVYDCLGGCRFAAKLVNGSYDAMDPLAKPEIFRKMGKILFYVEAEQGLGHIVRSQNIIAEIRSINQEIEIVCVTNTKATSMFRDCRVIDKTEILRQTHIGNAGELTELFDATFIPIIQQEQPNLLIFDTFYSINVCKKFENIRKILILRKYYNHDLKLFFAHNYHQYFDLVLVPHLRDEFDNIELPQANNIVFIDPIVRREAASTAADMRNKYGTNETDLVILATAGGGGFPDAEAFVDCCKNAFEALQKQHSNWKFVLVSGPLLEKKVKSHSHICVVPFEHDFPGLLSIADLVISQAGYNTVNEIIYHKKPAIIIPSKKPNDDQFERAEYVRKKFGFEVLEDSDSSQLRTKILDMTSRLSERRSLLNELEVGTGNRAAARGILNLIRTNSPPYASRARRSTRIRYDHNCNNNCVFCDTLDIRKKLRTPKHVHLIFSGRCNLGCVHCDHWKTTHPEMALDDIKKAVTKMRQWLGPFELKISGKETFMRNDVCDLVEFCAQQDVRVRLLTNATLIDSAVIVRLKKCHNYSLGISLDGFGDTHDAMRGKKGVYNKVIKTIRALTRNDIHPNLIAVITELNLDEIVRLVDFARANKLRIEFCPYAQNLGQKYDAEWYKKSPAWPKDCEKVNRIIDTLIEMKSKDNTILNSAQHLRLMKQYYKDPEKKILGDCRIGESMFVIRPNGNAAYCFQGPSIGNIFESDPAKIWCSDIAQQARSATAICPKNCDLTNCYYHVQESPDSVKKQILDLSLDYAEVIFPCNADCSEDFIDNLAYARKQGFSITLETNGRMFANREFAQSVAPLVDKFVVFLHGTEAIHNEVCQASSFSQTAAGIQNLLSLESHLQISTVVTKYNYGSLKDAVSKAKELGVKDFQLIFPILRDKTDSIPEVGACYQEIHEALLFARDSGLNVITRDSFENQYVPQDLNLDYDTAELRYEFSPPPKELVASAQPLSKQDQLPRDKDGRPILDHVALYPTKHCDQHCVFCDCGFIGDREFSTQEFFAIIDKLKQVRVNMVLITGGEPTCRNDLEAITQYISAQLGCPIRLYTNGVSLGPQLLERLIDAGLTDVRLTFHSHMPEVHDSITQLRGSWQKMIDNVESSRAILLKNKAKVMLSTNTIVIAENYKQLPQIVELAASCGVHNMIFGLPYYGPVCTGWSPLTKEQLRELYSKELPKALREAVQHNIEVEIAPLFSDLVGKPLLQIADELSHGNFDEELANFSEKLYGKKFYERYPCYSRYRGFFINNDGSVAMCCRAFVMGVPMGNIFNDSVAELVSRKELRDGHLCERCKYLFTANKLTHQSITNASADIEAASRAPMVSIIVPSFQRKELLETSLHSLFHQDYPHDKYEIIVVDDGSDDGTGEMVRQLQPTCHLKYVYWPRNKPYVFGEAGNRAGPSRNLGARYAQGEVLLFWDSDMIADPHMLKYHMDNYDPEAQAAALGIRKNLKQDTDLNGLHASISSGKFECDNIELAPDTRVGKMLAEINYNIMASAQPWFFVTSNNLLVGKKTFEESGGFATDFVFWGDEDQELGYRLLKNGVSFHVNTKAVGYHQPHEDEFVNEQVFLKTKNIHKNIFYKKHLDKDIFLFYRRFFDESQTTSKNNIPSSITINLTSLCNMRCPMCFDSLETRSSDVSMPLDTIKDVIDQLSELGIRRINFSGGEPTLRHDFFEILDYANQKQMLVDLSTNGSFDDVFAKELVTHSIDSIGFSIDFRNEGRHDKFRGRPALFKRVMQNITILKPHARVYLKTVVMAPNLEELPELVGFAHQLGLQGVSLQAFNPFEGILEKEGMRRNLKRHIDVDSLWVKPEQYALLNSVMDQLVAIKKEKGVIMNSVRYLEILKDYFRQPSNASLGIKCTCGSYFGINYDGRVMPCWGIDWSIGNVKETPLREILASDKYEEARRMTISCDIPCLLMCYEKCNE